MEAATSFYGDNKDSDQNCVSQSRISLLFTEKVFVLSWCFGFLSVFYSLCALNHRGFDSSPRYSCTPALLPLTKIQTLMYLYINYSGR